jgi:hypothetical protein
VRRHATARISALWLIALILLPWTAPFRTFDLSHSSGHQRFETVPKDKADGDATLLVKPATAGLPVSIVVSTGTSRPRIDLDPGRAGPAVLRI